MKTCFKCGQLKTLDNFYRHPAMGDGHLGKCKDCTRRDVADNYRKRIDHYRKYERERFNRPERKAAVSIYQRVRKLRHPEKYAARVAVGNAVRDKRLIRQPCEVCGDPVSQAHHDDYSKPLDVRWMCFRHHREIAHGQIVASIQHQTNGDAEE
jgi:ribosomal protein S27AE